MLCWQCKCELLWAGDTGRRWTDVAAAVTQTHLTWGWGYYSYAQLYRDHAKCRG